MNKPKHLIYEQWGAPSEHPQTVMRELGITYQHATPQSLYDQWWFWNCINVPEKLPNYLRILDINPKQAIGYGLSKDMAKTISDYTKVKPAQ